MSRRREMKERNEQLRSFKTDFKHSVFDLNPLSANPTKWSNLLK